MEAATLEDLRALVECESPSSDTSATLACADVLDELAQRRINCRAQRFTVDGRTHLQWTFGRPRVLLLGHLDTVWPRGTLARWPLTVDGDRVSGPGVFDMKGGLVEMFVALASRDSLDGITILVTSDEEIGSTTSADLVRDVARGLQACLVLEPSADGALKTARKGVGMFTVRVTGRAAHAGLDPDSGINTTVEMATHVRSIARLGDPRLGTTVTPTVLRSGTTVNTVPGDATLAVDVRTRTVAEMQRVERALAALTPSLRGAEVDVIAESVRPPLEATASASLFLRAQEIARRNSMPPLGAAEVGGGSDGNLTAALGVPTLDGLGAVGGNAHAEGEWINLSSLRERAVIVTGLLDELLEGR